MADGETHALGFVQLRFDVADAKPDYGYSVTDRSGHSQITALNYLASGVPSRISSEARLTTSWPAAI